jgi:hypothetical protein
VTLLVVVVILTATYSLKASSQQIYPVESNEVPSDNESSIAYLRRSAPSHNDKEEVATDDQPGHYASLNTSESDRQLERPNDDKEEEDEDQEDDSSQSERGTTESVGGALPIYASESSQNDGELQEEDNSDLGITDSVGGETPFLGTAETTEEEDEEENNEPWITTEDTDKNSAATEEERRDTVQSETGVNEDEERTDGVDEQSIVLIPATEASDIHDEEDDEKEGDNVDVQPNEEEDSSATIPNDDNDESNGSSLASTVDSTVQEEEDRANTDTVEASEADVKIEVVSADEAKSLDVQESAVDNARLQTDGSLTEDIAPSSKTSESELVQEVDETINVTSSQSPDDQMDQNVAEDVVAES